MYSRYFPPDDAFLPIPQEEEPPAPPPQPQSSPRPAPNRAAPPRAGAAGDLLSGVTQEINKLLGGALGKFSLESLDPGDILLILIVLFLFVEGDDLDLAIALGLALLLSLGDSNQPPSPPADTEASHPAE